MQKRMLARLGDEITDTNSWRVIQIVLVYIYPSCYPSQCKRALVQSRLKKRAEMQGGTLAHPIGTHYLRSAMKRLDMTGICVIYAGENWVHGMPPCNREMVPHLERNERLVSWLQPANGGVNDQVPAIRVNDAFYTISLRMMKAIWRHVRLRKGFENIERAPYGGLKLKIPVTLLAEKLRTQSRFNVS
jgi:hypothetical protein